MVVGSRTTGRGGTVELLFEVDFSLPVRLGLDAARTGLFRGPGTRNGWVSGVIGSFMVGTYCKNSED